MKINYKYKHLNPGYLILETLVAIAVLGILIAAIFPTINFMLKRLRRTKYDAQASLLLQEGMEVAYHVFVNSSDWASVDTTKIYQPAQEIIVPVTVPPTYKWALAEWDTIPVETRFVRKIEVLHVCRDAAGKQTETTIDSCTVGTLDAKSLLVKTSIQWDEPSHPEALTANLLLTKLSP